MRERVLVDKEESLAGVSGAEGGAMEVRVKGL